MQPGDVGLARYVHRDDPEHCDVALVLGVQDFHNGVAPLDRGELRPVEADPLLQKGRQLGRWLLGMDRAAQGRAATKQRRAREDPHVTYSSRYIAISSNAYDTASGPMRRPSIPRYGTPTSAPTRVTNGWICPHRRDTIGRIT